MRIHTRRVILGIRYLRAGFAPAIVIVVCVWLLGTELGEAATLRGRVYDAATGEGVIATVTVLVPVGQAPLRLDSGEPVRYVGEHPIYARERMDIPRTQADGNFEFDGLAPGEKLVVVYPLGPGYSFAYAWPTLIDETDVQYVDLPLPKAGSITGTVVDPAGKPLAGTRVSLFYTDPEIQRFVVAGGHALNEVRSNEAGIFAFEQNVKPSASFRLEARDNEFLPIRSKVLTLQPGEQRDGILIRILETGFRVVVTVVDEQGQPLVGVPVLLRNTLPRPKELLLSPAHLVPISGFTNEEGRIEFRGLRPGPWFVLAADSARPGPGSRPMRKEFELSPTAAVKEFRVTLRPE